MVYSHLDMAHDKTAQTAITASIEKWWSKSDQELFVASILINPCFQTRLFACHSHFNLFNCQELLSQVYHRLYKATSRTKFFMELDDFLKGNGQYSNLEAAVAQALDKAYEMASISA
jgi:hypothetical protein